MLRFKFVVEDGKKLVFSGGGDVFVVMGGRWVGVGWWSGVIG